MLLALCSSVVEHQQPEELADILGGGPGAAATFAAGLLADPHPLVATGAGFWLRPTRGTDGIRRWWDSLGAVVDTGAIPTPEDADTWAADRTFGLITRFPISITLDVLCLLASALATKVSWEVPFAVVDGNALGPSPWASQLRRVLQSPRGDPRHRQFIVDSERAGTVAVHLTGARGGLLVGSVIAADPTVPSGDVLAAAHEIVAAEARRPRSVDQKSLFDLPLGAGQIWTVSEEPAETEDPEGREEWVDAVLPAWWAQTNLDLDHENLGFPATARGFAVALELDTFVLAAQQATMARYSAVGFEAAAVAELIIALSAPVTRPGRRRIATLRFGHPFAAVAAVSDNRPVGALSKWHEMPVFSAWVSEPADAD